MGLLKNQIKTTETLMKWTYCFDEVILNAIQLKTQNSKIQYCTRFIYCLINYFHIKLTYTNNCIWDVDSQCAAHNTAHTIQCTLCTTITTTHKKTRNVNTTYKCEMWIKVAIINIKNHFKIICKKWWKKNEINLRFSLKIVVMMVKQWIKPITME